MASDDSFKEESVRNEGRDILWNASIPRYNRALRLYRQGNLTKALEEVLVAVRIAPHRHEVLELAYLLSILLGYGDVAKSIREIASKNQVHIEEYSTTSEITPPQAVQRIGRSEEEAVRGELRSIVWSFRESALYFGLFAAFGALVGFLAPSYFGIGGKELEIDPIFESASTKYSWKDDATSVLQSLGDTSTLPNEIPMALWRLRNSPEVPIGVLAALEVSLVQRKRATQDALWKLGKFNDYLNLAEADSSGIETPLDHYRIGYAHYAIGNVARSTGHLERSLLGERSHKPFYRAQAYYLLSIQYSGDKAKAHARVIRDEFPNSEFMNSRIRRVLADESQD